MPVRKDESGERPSRGSAALHRPAQSHLFGPAAGATAHEHWFAWRSWRHQLFPPTAPADGANHGA